jgi:hypothetical protein
MSRLRREADELLAEARGIVGEMLHPAAMIAGSFYQMYKKCGRPCCRCTEGQLHGPYPVISLSEGGRRSSRSVPRDREQQVRKAADRYRDFQRNIRRVRRIFRRIERIVMEIRDAHLVEFP